MLVVFTHPIIVVAGSQGTLTRVDLEVTASGTVKTEPQYDTPFGPLNFQTVVEDVEIESCLNELGQEVFAKLESDDSWGIMQAAEKHLVREYERDFAGAE